MSGSNWGWTDGTITTNELYGFEEMTFRARIQCIELFDENGLEMNPKWKWHSKEAAEREHDEKTPNEHDAAQQLMEVATTKLVIAYSRWMMAEHRVSSVHSQWIVHLITLYSMDSDGQRLRGDDDWNFETAKAGGL